MDPTFRIQFENNWKIVYFKNIIEINIRLFLPKI